MYSSHALNESLRAKMVYETRKVDNLCRKYNNIIMNDFCNNIQINKTKEFDSICEKSQC